MVQGPRALSFGVVGALALLGASALAQSGQQKPVFRAETTVVPLTVTVLDRKGNPVTDLKASDFTVTENKRQREIVNFFPQVLTPGPVQPAPTGRARTGELAPASRRTFLIAIGSGRGVRGAPHKPFAGLIEFLSKNLLPQDAVAVMAFHKATPFTTDHQRIVEMVRRYDKQWVQLLFDLRLSGQRGFFGAPPPDEAKVLAAMDAVLEGAGPLRRISDLLLGMDRSVMSAVPLVGGDGLKLFAGLEYLRHLDGEKHFVFIGEPSLFGDAAGADTIARRANDAGVTIHVASTSSGASFRAPIRDVVELTGGYYSSLFYTNQVLASVDRATRHTYLLGYTPSNPNLDGKYREVDVKVNRPDVEVRFRHGYSATEAPDPLDLPELIRKARLEAALAYDQNATEIKLGVDARVLPRMGITSLVRVELTIDATSLGFELKDGVRSGQIELQIYCGNAKERIVCDSNERLAIDAGEEQYQEYLQKGIRYSTRVPVTEVPKYLKVVVYDYGSDRVGSFMFTIK